MKKNFMSAAAVLALAASLVAVGGGSALASSAERAKHGGGYTDGRYLVTFADEAVASYDGYEAGFAATRPEQGRKLDPNSPAVQRWQQHIVAKHDAALARVGATKIYDYTVANNGVAVELTGKQASDLAATPGVVGLEKDTLAQPATTVTPEFLGLTGAGGLWSQLGGDSTCWRGHHRRRHRHRHLARKQGVRRRHRHPRAGRLAGPLRRGRAVHQASVQ